MTLLSVNNLSVGYNTKKGLVKAIKPKKLTVKKAEKAAAIDKLPEPFTRPGWIKVIAPDGELRRDGDVLYYQGEEAGSKQLEILNFKID